MPQALSVEKLARVRVGLEMDTKQKTIAQKVNVSKRQVTRIKHNIVYYGSVKRPKKPLQGRQPKITEGMAEDLLEFLTQKSNAQRDEMVYFIWDTFDISVSESCIGRLLRKKKWTKKVLQRRAAERSQELRDDWLHKICEWRGEQLIFLDESAANEKSAHRKYGWAPIGTTPHIYSPIKRSERWSLLPAYAADGFIAWQIIQGSFNTELFNDFVRNQVLPQCNPFPGPKSIIIMDNCPIHHNNELQEMCDEAGVRLEFLPPYSPDYNPIEEAFAELKQWLKKNYMLASGYESFDGFLNAAMLQLSRKPGNHFRSCHIQI